MRSHPVAPAVLAWAVLAALAPPGARAQQVPSAGDTLAALKADHKKAMDAFSAAYDAAKTDAERDAVYKEAYPKPESFTARALAIAKAAPKDPAAAECLVWALQNDRGPSGDALLEALVRDHLQSEKLAEACQALAYGSSAAGQEAFLREVLAKSPHREVQARAAFSLAKYLQSRGDLALRLQCDSNQPLAERLAKIRGDAWLEAIRKADPEALQKEAEALFTKIVADYADVKSSRRTFGEEATAELFELQHLAVGKQAPEIVGKDLDGVEFKLSDYRGKVVFLDFWGYW